MRISLGSISIVVASTLLSLSSIARAGEGADYFDKPIAEVEPVAPPGSEEIAKYSFAAAPQPTTPVPRLTVFFSGGYLKSAKAKGTFGGSYSFQSTHVDLEPAFTLVGSDIAGDAITGTATIDVTIAPKLGLEHLQLGIDPELDISDEGDLTYAGTLVGKAFFGDNAHGKVVIGASPALSCKESDCGYSVAGSLGYGHDFGRNNASVTLKPKVAAATFSSESTVGASLELLLAIPVDQARKLRIIVIPSASDLGTIGGTFGVVAKAQITL